MKAKSHAKRINVRALSKLLLAGEQDVGAGRTRSMKSFLKAFRKARRQSR